MKVGVFSTGFNDFLMNSQGSALVFSLKEVFPQLLHRKGHISEKPTLQKGEVSPSRDGK